MSEEPCITCGEPLSAHLGDCEEAQRYRAQCAEAARREALFSRRQPTGSGDFSIGSDFWPGISKLIEEAGEVLQVCGKLIASHGANEHWDGGDLRERLQNEIADVTAACAFVADRNKLDVEAMEARVRRKLGMFDEWHSKADNNVPTGIPSFISPSAPPSPPTWEQLVERAAADNVILKHSADHADIQLVPKHSLMGAPFLVFRRVELAEPEADEILRRCVDGALKTMKDMY